MSGTAGQLLPGTVAYLLNRATAAAGGRELRGMAAPIGLPH